MAPGHMRFVALFLLCMFLLCSFSNFNSPGSLQQYMIAIYGFGTYQYTVLYSMITWASLLDLVHGYIIDRYLGLKWGTILYMSVMIVGGLLYTAAAFIGKYWLLLFSRFLFGFGLNPLILTTNGYLYIWFGEKEVNLAFSILESMMWMGTSLVYFSSVKIYALAQTKFNPFQSLAVTIGSETITILMIMTISLMAVIFITPFEKKEETQSLVEKGEQEGKTVKEEKSLTFLDYVSFPPIFWFYALTVFLHTLGFISFLSLSQVFFVTNYGCDVDTASELSGLLTILVCILAPIIGITLDKIGQNLTCLQLCQIVTTVGILFLAYGNKYSPFIPVVLIAIGVALQSSSWSVFPNVVKKHQVLVAFGIVQTGVCITVSVGTLIGGVVTDKYGYHGLTIFILITEICSILCLLVVWVLNYKLNNPLNKNKLLKTKDAKEAIQQFK